MAKRSKRTKAAGSPVGGGGGMMQQMQALQQQLLAAQDSLAEESVTTSAGGGAIKVTVTGDQHIQAIEIDPAVLEDADVEMLQDLILTALNAALDQSRELAANRLGPLAGGLPF